MGTIKDNAKLLALKHEIELAIQNNTLNEQMDVFRLKAADIEIDGDNLNKLIEEIKQENHKKVALTQTIAPKKKWISISSIGIVVIEWVLAFVIAKGSSGEEWNGLSFGNLALLFIINIVSVLALIIGFSIVIKYKKNNK